MSRTKIMGHKWMKKNTEFQGVSSCPTDLWFLIIGVGNLLSVIPVLWLFGFRVFNLFGRQEVPVILQIAGLDLLIVDLDLVGVVWVDNQRVQVGVLIILQGVKDKFAAVL